jgi:hypothetical protein
VLEVQIDAAPRPVVPYLTDFVGTSSCALAVEDSSPDLVVIVRPENLLALGSF